MTRRCIEQGIVAGADVLRHNWRRDSPKSADGLDAELRGLAKHGFVHGVES